MASSLTIRQARLVLPDRVVKGDLVVRDGVITQIGPRATDIVGEVVDADGLVALPGLVDTHLRLGGLDDFGSDALLAGGITSAVGVHDGTTGASLPSALAQVAATAAVHFGLYVRVGDSVTAAIEAERARGIWVDPAVLYDEARAERVFRDAHGLVCVEHHHPGRVRERWHLYADSTDPLDVPRVHDVDTCLMATRRALDLARRHGTRAHLLHLSTAEETRLLPLPDRVTAAVHPAQLFHESDAYDRLGTRAICLPPLRGPRHRDALWEALQADGVMMASGHWPVGAWAKKGALHEVHPGWPTAEWWLPLMMDAVAHGRATLRDVARWTSERPAALLGLRRKGRLEAGFDADIVLVDPERTAVVGEEAPVRTTAGWSPWLGHTLRGWPVRTIVRGVTAFHDGVRGDARGRELT